MKDIERKQYPELDFILWDVHSDTVEPEFAFMIYEKRWGYVQKNKLTDKESKLIEQLTETWGNGLFMPAY